MQRKVTRERDSWQQQAQEFGFHFHTMYGEPYWDESAYYQFTLEQIEKDLEEPTEELHQMCLQVVDRVIGDEVLMRRFQIPENHWDWIQQSWKRGDKTLYSRLDLAYNGHGPAKLLENNADTPTSLYETGFWQWLWLEDKIADGSLPSHVDQFNSLQEKLIERFKALAGAHALGDVLHISCCKDTEEDRGTVQYLEDCAREAGIDTRFVYIEDIGQTESGQFTDLDDQLIGWMFKLYPWEFMLRENYSDALSRAGVDWIEPAWKAIVSNKALLPMLWQMFPNHPNLLPAFFEDELQGSGLTRYVKKPIFAREGANVSIHIDGREVEVSDGPYGEEGYVVQAYSPLPEFEGSHTLIGSWLVDGEAAGLSVREDRSLITQDLSRFLPHVILD